MKQKQKGDKDQKDIAWEIGELHNLKKKKYKAVKKGVGKNQEATLRKEGQDHCIGIYSSCFCYNKKVKEKNIQ